MASGMLKSFLMCLLWTHLGACLWYLVGELHDDGWSRQHPKAGWDSYFAAAHLAMTQLHGTSSVHPHNEAERVLGLVSLLVGFVCFALCVSEVTFAVFQLAPSRSFACQEVSNRYMARHGLSRGSVVVRRTNWWLKEQRSQLCMTDQLAKEQQMLGTFPAALRDQLLAAVRAPWLKVGIMYY